MPRMRSAKKQIKQWLAADTWQAHLDAIARLGGKEATGPLLAMLLYGGEMMHRAAVAIGICVAQLAEQEPEAARNILRRLMWHMNEESGNIGWGIPEAFAEILARSPRMAQEFHAVLISYIVDTGKDDNFCDHDILRRSCYWAVGRLAQSRPDLTLRAQSWLIRGLSDPDTLCRGMAAWALGQMPVMLQTAPLLRRVAEAGTHDTCVIFDGTKMGEYSVSELAAQALHHKEGTQ